MLGTWKFEIGDIIKEMNINTYSYRSYHNIFVVDGYYTSSGGGRHYVLISTEGHISIQEKISFEANHIKIGKSECPEKKPDPIVNSGYSAYGMCR